ncbi:MAG: LITAF-like zinc ribbon domain-containing protein [Saprospiraceae bacterium]|nr:LITAF-like zinc ribbon domain-containing protein [Pyrinomonadaceae bacterium]
MIQCQNCGQSNSDTSQFCRFCGTKFLVRQPNAQDNYDYQSPRPYAWKTDEYQTQSEPRPPKMVARTEPLAPPAPLGNQQYGGQPLAYAGPQYLAGNYRCPHCGTQYLPIIERRISTAGWITFSLLLVFTFIFFWIGLLMKENVSICPVCRTKVS